MSENAVDLRRKIGGAGELQSVVKAMKALAASSIGQYEKSVNALADYSRTIEMGLTVCFRHIEPAATIAERNGKTGGAGIGAVVFGSDQGLVGQFNEVIAEYATKEISTFSAKPRIWAVGERVHARLLDAGLDPVGLYGVPNSVQEITPLIGAILVAGRADNEPGEAGELHLFYNRPKTGKSYFPVSQRLLPLDEKWLRKLAARPWPTVNLPEVLGARATTLRTLIREYLFISMFRACAESLASENASRLEAMQRAEKNIDELLEELNTTYHRLRQSGIDAELFDVIAGFEALNYKKPQPQSSF